MPIISVVIPAYNAETTISETIASVQNQTFSDIEIIIINDGSTDQTLNIVQNFTDPRIKVFSYENGGLPVARNRGIDRATGEFISFIDADDLWTPDKLEKQLASLKANSKAAVAYSWTQTIDRQGNLLHRYNSIFLEGDVYSELLVNNFIGNGSNILVRQEAISTVGKFDPKLKSCEDWDFYIRLAAKYHFVVVPNWQILYRLSSTTMTSKIDIMEISGIAVIEKAYQSAPLEYQSLKNQSLAWIYEYCTQQCLRCNNDLAGVKIASQKFWKAVQLHPKILLEDYGQNLLQWLLKRWILTLVNSIFNNN